MFADAPPTPAADVSSQPANETAGEILLRQATRFVFANPAAATVSALRKEFSLSPGKVVHLIDALVEAGILGAVDGAGTRPVIITELPKWAGADLAKPSVVPSAVDLDTIAAEQQAKDATAEAHAPEALAPAAPVDFYRPETVGKAETAGEPREQITYIPLAKLFPSQTPAQVMRRESYSKSAIAELASSIKAQGVLQTLLVRPRPGSWEEADEYEIVAGERRWLACLSIETVPHVQRGYYQQPGGGVIRYDPAPCIVRKLTDVQVMELQLVENLQREGIHPLEEAAGYRALLELRSASGDKDENASVAYISQQAGKSVSYIFQRLKLLALIKGAKEAFQTGELSPSHALDCARLAPRDQNNYLEAFRANGPGLSPSVRQMRDWIARYARIDLARAPFKLKDGKLLEGVPACSACPKCSIAQAELFADFTEQASPAAKRKKGEKATALCMDPTCYGHKLDAFAVKSDTTREAIEPAAPDDRPQNAYLAKLYDYAPRGDAQIILDERAKQQGASTDEIRKEEHRRFKEKLAREQAFKQICRSLPGHTQSTEDLRDIASAFYASLHYDNRKALVKLLGWKTKERDLEPADVIAGASHGCLKALLLKCALVGEVNAPNLEPELLEAVGQRYGVSLKELRKPQSAPKEKKSKKSRPTAVEKRMSPAARKRLSKLRKLSKRLSELRELRKIAKTKSASKGEAKKKGIYILNSPKGLEP
jgi:hypothetical protein